MRVEASYALLESGGSPMRTYVVRPRGRAPYPGIVAFSDIFGLTGSTCRALDRLASYGYVVMAPEIYHRIEPAGSAIPFDDAGRTRGSDDAKRTAVADFDADARTVVTAFAADAGVARGALGAVGWCLGGHLALRAALLPQVRATVCFYPTGVHSGELGADADAGTLGRLPEIAGELLLVFGSLDPHVGAADRERIVGALERAKTRYAVSLYEAEHAFMRDEGPRYDAELTDRAYREAVAFLKRALVA